MEKYKCVVCKNEYEKVWTDKEANAEAKEIWGVDKASEKKDMVVLCDDCFKRITLKEIKVMGEQYQELQKNKR